jgi:isoquinoline 1-oxidoreductase beta subunit
MGETGTSGIVPAISNAIFAATGKRLRRMPVDSAALKQT